MFLTTKSTRKSTPDTPIITIHINKLNFPIKPDTHIPTATENILAIITIPQGGSNKGFSKIWKK